jgi:hypothetical protein
VVCSRYASRAPVIQGSLVNFLSPARRVGLFSACVPLAPVVRSGSKEVWEQRTRSRNVLRALMGERSDRNGGACAHEGANRGRSPQDVGRCSGG